MPSGTRLRRAHLGLSGAVGLAVVALLAACDADPPPPDDPVTTDPPPAPADAAFDQLAALAAAAQDRHYTASYTLSVDGRPDRTVSVTDAADGTWRVDIPGGALGGTTDVSLARTGVGLFQCALPSAQRPEPTSCVRVADPDGELPRRIDPRVQHPFTDWLDVMTDRQAPLSVSVTRPLPGATGTCFSVESTSASLRAPLDVGIYCFGTDGTLTAAKAEFGSLRLVGAPGAAPPTVSLAGPVTGGEPVGLAPAPESSATTAP